MLPVTKRAIPLGLCRAHAQPKDRWAEGVKAVSRRRPWRAAPALRPAVHRSTKIQLLPGERLSCLRRRAGMNLRDLTPAPRRQDHTTSPYASATLVRRSLRVHRISPHVRDDRDPSLSSGETARAGSADLPDGESGIFFARGLDRFLSRRLICPSGRFVAPDASTLSLRAKRSNP